MCGCGCVRCPGMELAAWAYLREMWDDEDECGVEIEAEVPLLDLLAFDLSPGMSLMALLFVLRRSCIARLAWSYTEIRKCVCISHVSGDR